MESRSKLSQKPLHVLAMALSLAGLHFAPAFAADKNTPLPILLKAQHLFNGVEMSENAAVLIVDGKIKAVGSANDAFAKQKNVREIVLGDATLLPGLIDLHTHVLYQHVPQDKVMEHGITTVRDLGGALQPISGGNGQLRVLTAGAVVTVAGGYPLTVFGGHNNKHHHYEHGHDKDLAAIVESPEQAQKMVHQMIEAGASVIKIALEPGGEAGAAWSNHGSTTPLPWPMLSLAMVKSITEEAHKHGKVVSAHLAETEGVKLALEGGVDEWAHAPCLEVSDELLQQAAAQKVKIVPTLDTLAACPGVHQNVKKLAQFGAEFLYGSELAHPDIPWGIDGQELQLMAHLTGLTPLQVLQSATSKSGKYLGLAPLGTIAVDAPADLIAVKGNPLEKLKLLEYPDLVISGGKLIVNKFEK